MKILLTMNLPYTRAYGGANRSNRALAEALANRDHSVSVVVPSLAAVSSITHRQFREELAAEGIRVNSNGESDVFSLNGVEVHAVVEPSRLCGYLAGQIRKLQPHWTLVSSEDRSQALLESALKAHPERVIYLAHTPQMFPFGPAGLFPGKRRTELVGQASAVITISRFVAAYIQQWTGLDSNTHHPPHYGSGPFPNFGNVNNDYVLLMNACAVKGLSIFLALARAMPDVRFAALPGWGTTAAERIALSGLRNVTLLSNSKNLDDVFCRTRAVLMPSLWVEGFGMAAVDAMLRGIPVLASNYGGLIEAKLGTDYLLPVNPIERFEDRLDDNLLPVPIVPPQDIEPWQNVLSHLVSDRELYQRQSAAARDAALRFVRGLSVEPLEDFLRRLLIRPKTGPGAFLGKLKQNGSQATVSDTAKMKEGIDALTPEQQALLILRLRKDAISRAKRELPVSSIQPVSRDQELPLSFSQQRLWFLDQYEPNSSVYNISSALRLKGSLDVAALERSLNEIVRRHEALRTTFRSVEGSPRQVIADELILPLPVIDLSDDLESVREEKARGYATVAARRPFDLSHGPLIRAMLLRLGEEEHDLLLSMHHIVSDGWSMMIFFREFSAIYDAYVSGKASPLAELPIQYADYAVWQRNWLQGEVLEKQLSYWRGQLANISPLNLATDRPRPPVRTFRGGRESLRLSQDLTRELKELSRKQAASLFMTLLAALQVLLHRLTAQDDIAVGSPIASRNRAEIEDLIGFFLNTLVLRTKLSVDATFLQVLEHVRGVCLDAYAHQDVPFEKLLEELRPERDLSRTPFFQVFLNMGNVGERVRPAGLQLEPISYAAETESKFDLTIYVRERNGTLQLDWVYNTDLFDRERIQEMSRQFEKLLSQISEQPTASVHAYSLLTPAAKEWLPNPLEPLASDWAGPVHDKLSQYARSFPDRIAITDPNGSWTYAEFNARSNKLANYLLGSGIQRGEIIAIYGHRSAALPWALLGVLKVGAAFLILDPAYPTARLIQYIRSARPWGLIGLDAAGAIPPDLERAAEGSIRCRVELPRVSDAGLGKFFDNCSSADPQLEIRPDDLAYISYTSGSTGEPKGVQGRHGSLSHFLPWQAAHFGLTCADRFSLLSGLSHDPLHREILTALWVGATLCIPDADLIGASGELTGWMAGQRITFAHLTPALGRLLADSAKPECKIPSLRYAFFIGEKLTRRDVSCLRRLAPQVTNVNYYGSTETQRAVSYYEVVPQGEDGPGGSVLPVGRGMPGAQLLILTRTQNLTGIGEVGEIYMRSPHLARGYLDDPSLTQERFITNPFTSQPDDRMYRTGDLGRYLPDGTVEVLGRMDGQINIRGFRVETGEIEFAISQYRVVRDVVVVARENAIGDTRLVAYIVASQEPGPSVHELRSFLKQRLPEHMVPSAFVYLESLPLTPNAKVDRSALPEPDYTRQAQDTAQIAPRDQLELQLREIWEKVLRIRAVGVRDNFFDLGGHSLLAVRLFAQIEKVTGKRLPVAALFRAPTIEQLAQLMSQQGGSEQWKSLVAIQPGGSRAPFFCVHAHDGGVLFWRDLARYLGSDQPFYALQPRGLDGQESLHTRIEDMAAYYVKELRTLQPEGPYYIGGHCLGGLVAFEMAQQLYREGQTVGLLALFDSFAPLKAGRSRISLFRRYRYRAIRLFERTISLHIGNLLVLNPGERLPYLKTKFNKALYKLYMTLGSPWVFAARNRSNILKAGREASRTYRPQIYPGTITLFRATQLGGGISHDPEMGWGRLAGGTIRTHLIPGYHAHIVLEPRVRLLAKELIASLSKAQEITQANSLCEKRRAKKRAVQDSWTREISV